jgi:hypothetical protein
LVPGEPAPHPVQKKNVKKQKKTKKNKTKQGSEKRNQVGTGNPLKDRNPAVLPWTSFRLLWFEFLRLVSSMGGATPDNRLNLGFPEPRRH